MTWGCGGLWRGSVWGRELHTPSTTLSTTIDRGLFVTASLPPASPSSCLCRLPCAPFLLRFFRRGLGGRQHWSPSLGASPLGGRCLYSPLECNAVVLAVHLYPLRTTGHTPYPGTPTLSHTGVPYTLGHVTSPCGADVSPAGPDGRCALAAAPHWARTAVRAVGSAPCEARWAPPRPGATKCRWPTVAVVSRLLAAAQAGPMRSLWGAGGLTPPLRFHAGVPLCLSGVRSRPALSSRLLVPVSPAPPLSRPLSWGRSPARIRPPVAPCFMCIRCWRCGSRCCSARPRLWPCWGRGLGAGSCFPSSCLFYSAHRAHEAGISVGYGTD